MKYPIVLAIILLSSIWLLSCDEAPKKDKYLRWVGDIEQNDKLDDPNFKVCNGENGVFQYFNLSNGPQYLGEKPKIERLFKEEYQVDTLEGQSGWLRVRFIVNCEGKAGRYRLLEADQNYKAFEFEEEISSSLFEITKSIESWPIQYKDENPIDYYYYLTFKLKDGQIQEILP